MARKPERKTYRPTDAAGPYVAGQRVPTILVEGEHRRDPDFTIDLTEPQARYELANGAIEEVPEPAPSEGTGKGGRGKGSPPAGQSGGSAGGEGGGSDPSAS